MYRLGRQHDKHRKLRRNIIIIVSLLLFGGLIYLLVNLRVEPEQQIRNAPAVSQQFGARQEAKVLIDKSQFSLELPHGWKEVPVSNAFSAPKYTFKSPSKDATQLDLYIDNPPERKSLNKVIVVSTQGTGLAYDTVSENCTTFTDAKLKNPATGEAPARWQTTNFICDMSNSSRAVVGTVSSEGINQVTVRGNSGKTYKIFIAYTDNSISPNYSTLYDILKSMHFK